MKRSLIALALLVPGVAEANPLYQVVSAFEGEDFAGSRLHGQVTYEFALSRGDLRREHAGFAVEGTPLGAVPERPDLTYKTLRHVIVPSLELGLFRGLSFGVALPVTIRQRSTLSVTDFSRTASSTIRDGILPMAGFDSQRMGGPTDASSSVLFRSPDRAGLEALHLMLTYALSDGQREPWLPTWKVAVGLELAIGSLMKLDSQNPSASSGVSTGVHALLVKTSLAKRVDSFLPFVEVAFRAPLMVRSGAPLAEPDTIASAPDVDPPMQISGDAGVEWWLWQRAERGHRLALGVSGGATAVTRGRDYSPLWEAFALAGDPIRTGPLVLDRDPSTAEIEPLPYGGPSTVQGHLRGRLGFELGLIYAGQVEVALATDLGWQEAHFVSAAEQGAMINPLHVPLIDQAGRRYRQSDAFDVISSLRASVSF